MCRAYFFGNMYLSGIQQGIQALHVVGNMAVKYHPEVGMAQSEMFYDWAADHKTVTLLNGGDCDSLEEIYSFIEGDLDSDSVRLNDHYNGYSPYPFEIFREEGIADAASSVGIVLPPKIYEGAKKIRGKFTQEEAYLWKKEKTMAIPLFNEFNRPTGETEEHTYNDWEIELMKRMNRCKLAI